MPENHRYLGVRLQMEQQRFISFAMESGLLSTDKKVFSVIDNNQKLLRDILVEVKTLFEQFEALNGKYVSTMKSDEEGLGDGIGPRTSLVDLVCRTQDMINGRTISSSHNEAPSVNERLAAFRDRTSSKAKKLRTILVEPKRLVWVNADQESFEQLIRKLGELNSYLTALLDHSRIARQAKVVESSYLEILQLKDDVESLRTLVRAFGDEDTEPDSRYSQPLQKFWDDPVRDSSSQRSTDENIRSYFKTLASIKIQRIAIDESGCMKTSNLLSDDNPKLDLSSSFQFKSSCSLEQDKRPLEVWNGHSIWFEWLTYQPPGHRSQNTGHGAEARLLLLANLLSKRLPKDFRAPPCLGYVKSRTQYGEPRLGVVFEKPSDTWSGANLESLRDLLGKRPKPPLCSRISLCKALAQCLHSFHAVNWLHKGLRSSNILFFGTETEWQYLCRPYVTGFDLSRPGEEPELTEQAVFDPLRDIYRHPLAQSGENSSHYRKSYDIYSLGIIFLEVAHWKPIEVLLEVSNLVDIKFHELQGVRRLLLKGSSMDTSTVEIINHSPDLVTKNVASCLRKVGDKCGDALQDIIEICLMADEIERPAYRGESNISRNHRLRVMFEEQVLARLRVMKEALQGVGNATY